LGGIGPTRNDASNDLVAAILLVIEYPPGQDNAINTTDDLSMPDGRSHSKGMYADFSTVINTSQQLQQ
jgi:hypothetical protein